MDKTIICPKCSHVRPKDATNPEWQCPACGVCYAKAGDTSPRSAPDSVRAQPIIVKQGWDLGTLFKIILFVLVGWGITHYIQGARNGGAGTVDERLRSAAAGSSANDLILYSAEWCGYCKQAKETFAANNIPYTNCDTETDPRCAREFSALNGTGVPLFVVKGERLHEGLNYEALITALEKPKADQAPGAGVALANAALQVSGADAGMLRDIGGKLEASCARNKYGLSESACVDRVRQRGDLCANKTASKFPGQIGNTDRMQEIVQVYVGCIFEGSRG